MAARSRAGSRELVSGSKNDESACACNSESRLRQEAELGASGIENTSIIATWYKVPGAHQWEK